jgi:phosphoribosyl 1,2-cyclic phosphodiesterase
LSVNGDFFVRFWGVRGSVACSAPDIIRYGGNTSTLEIWCGDQLLIFDAGTGLRYLGNTLITRKGLKAKLFLTHTHFDHVCGMPFFKPAFVPSNEFEIWAGHLLPKHTIRYALTELMMAPLFPVPLEIFQCKLSFHDFKAGETLRPYPDVEVQTSPLNHPNGATGYRVNYKGRSICYLTDTEHRQGGIDQAIIGLIRGADLVVYDGMYTDDEYKNRVGWGHSTWQEGARLCEAANVGQYCVFHHDPDHNDDFMDEVARQVATLRPGSIVAKEGMVLRPGNREPAFA